VEAGVEILGRLGKEAAVCRYFGASRSLGHSRTCKDTQDTAKRRRGRTGSYGSVEKFKLLFFLFFLFWPTFHHNTTKRKTQCLPRGGYRRVWPAGLLVLSLPVSLVGQSVSAWSELFLSLSLSLSLALSSP